MKKFSAESPGLFDRVDHEARLCSGNLSDDVDYSQINFSDLCTFLEYVELSEYGGGERWCDHGSREKTRYRFPIVFSEVQVWNLRLCWGTLHESLREVVAEAELSQ
jgi:hypothetical protein